MARGTGRPIFWPFECKITSSFKPATDVQVGPDVHPVPAFPFPHTALVTVEKDRGTSPREVRRDSRRGEGRPGSVTDSTWVNERPGESGWGGF